MNERQMRYFAKVVEIGNMTKAAALLNVAQPALGLQIRQLEDRLQVPLLDRHSRGVEPTLAGRVLYDHAIAILAHFERAESDVRNFGGQIETIALGITHSMMRIVGQDLMVAARRDIPAVRFSYVEEPSIVLLREVEAGQLDLAFTYSPSDSQAIRQTPIQREELLFVTRADQAPEEAVVGLEHILAYELVLAGERDPIRQMVDDAARQANLRAEISYEVQSLMTSRQMVLDGLAASILPYGVIADELEKGLVAMRRITGAPFKRTLYLTRSNRRPHFQNEEQIMRLVRSAIKQLTLDLGELAEPLGPDI